MIKIRIMGTKRDIQYIRKQIERNGNLQLTEFSDCFPMKDTKRYYRAYVEVEKTTDMLRKMNNESNDDVPETSYFGTGTRYNK